MKINRRNTGFGNFKKKTNFEDLRKFKMKHLHCPE